MSRPVKVLVFQNRFLLGGQERQTVMNVRTMDRTRFEPVVACLRLDGEMLADLAVNQPEGFATIAKQAKAALDKAA